MTVDAGFELVRAGGYAFYADAATAYPTVSRLFEPGQICDLNQIELRASIVHEEYQKPFGLV